MRRHLNYANVTATLALFFAMSGGALAAHHYLVQSTKQISPKVLKALRGRTGPKGVSGPTGPAGATGKEGPAGKEATNPPLTWQPLTLVNGWHEFTVEGVAFYGPPSYTKDAEGFVHLSGALDGLSRTNVQFATLPEGFRPRAANIWLRAGATNGSGDPHLVDIAVQGSSGVMDVATGKEATAAFVSLEGLTFYAG